MGIAKSPSAVTLPEAAPPYPSILAFLIRAFPHVGASHWEERLRAGKLFDDDGPITAATAYRPGKRIFYFREVATEPVIPFAEQILFRNDEILVADKPHFLPVVPGGHYVNECLQQRLRDCTGVSELVPLHRIDRETAGLVLCSLNPATRGRYHALFVEQRIEKTYHALAAAPQAPPTDRWVVENRLVRGEPRFRMQIVPGPPNARSEIRLLAARGQHARFELRPITGKTHQLRLHLSSLGFPILNDRYYPELQPQRADDFARPLQLIAKTLRFRDPVSGTRFEFQSTRELLT
jgi:tRNA pseudouridine32 synthase/23S rRNA pseudouridine746 synthase